MLATNETYFFRELPQLRAFEREVLPSLHALGRVKQALTIWSAGCSTGEEAYTIAILLARSGLFTGWNVRVIGWRGWCCSLKRIGAGRRLEDRIGTSARRNCSGNWRWRRSR